METGRFCLPMVRVCDNRIGKDRSLKRSPTPMEKEVEFINSFHSNDPAIGYNAGRSSKASRIGSRSTTPQLHRSGDAEFQPDADDRQRRGKDGSCGSTSVSARATASPKASAYPHERSVSPPRIALSGSPPLRRQQEFFVHMIHALNELTIF